jgi:hypothetical protein
MTKNRGEILAPVSPGELLDKIAILEIKEERIVDEKKRANVRIELEALRRTALECLPGEPDLTSYSIELKRINEAIWEIEDDIRRCEKEKRFDTEFIELARSVYKTNDRRAAVKRLVNQVLSSELVEEKSYVDYEGEQG